MRRPLLLCCATACLLTCLGSTRAAEACIPLPTAGSFTGMEARRAVIWLRQDTFEMMFQNQYAGDAADFAWVIPLPGVPVSVEQPSDGFVEKLDAYTAPLFESRECHVPCRGPDWMPDAGATLPGGNIAPPQVAVWASGKLGDLEYKVLSAKTAADLVAWLEPRGYALPSALAPLIDDYLAKGFTFFAAKIAAGAASGGNPATVPVVKFVFDSAQTKLVYPLRISAYNRQDPLDTLIWVVADKAYQPKGPYKVEPMDEPEHDQTSYGKALDAAMAQDGGTTFAVQYADVVGGLSNGDMKRQMLYGMYGSSPDAEMGEILAKGLTVVRLRARLNPKGTNDDLELELPASGGLDVEGIYVNPCPGGVTYEKCDAGAPAPPTDGGVPDVAPEPVPPTPPADPSGSDPGDPTEPTDPAGSVAGDDDGGCQLASARMAPTLTLLGLALALLFGRRRR